MRVLGYVLLGAVALILAVCAIVGVVLYQAFVPTDPRYASPVSQQAAEGALAIPVDFCAADRPHCEGHLQFVRGSALLLVRGVDHVSAHETATGRLLWALPEEELRTAQAPPDFIETHDGEYAFLFDGQVVDLDEGRIAFRGDTYMGGPDSPLHERVRRVRPGVYRFPYYRGVYLVDLTAGRVLPYAHRDAGVSEALPERTDDAWAPYHGPVDQTDDGAFAVLLTAENEPHGPFILSVHSRDHARELWRTTLPESALGAEVWIDGRVVHVSFARRVRSYALRTGAFVAESDAAEEPPSHHWRSDLRGDCVTICRPGQWTEINSSASADRAVVALYEAQAPERGIRMHSGYFTGSSMEAGRRRLRVTRGVNGPTIFTRPMEEGRTTTRGYDTAVAVSNDNAKVAVLATDGVVRIYALPPISGGDNE